jgi:hypothetical protein
MRIQFIIVAIIGILIPLLVLPAEFAALRELASDPDALMGSLVSWFTWTKIIIGGFSLIGSTCLLLYTLRLYRTRPRLPEITES